MTAAAAPRALRTLTGPGDTPWLADALLVLTLLQGTSMTLSLAVRLDASGRGAALVTLGWLASYVLGALLLLTRAAPDWLGWLLRYRLVLVLLVAGVGASTLWSVAPSLTLERAVHFAGSTIVAVALGMTVPLARMLQLARRVFAVLIVLSVVTALLVPDIGIENYEGRLVWRGLTASKNTLGFWSAIAVLLFLLPALEPRRLASRAALLLLTALALLCLAQSVSATSLLSLLIALLMLSWLATTRGLSLGLLASGGLALIALMLSAIAIRYIDTAELIGRSGDLTGRGELWAQTWRLIQSRPLTGYGYGTLWYPTEASVWIQQSLLDLNWVTYHAHNGLLHLASGIGLPLTVLAVLFAVQQLIEVVHVHHRSGPAGALFVLGFMIALLVSNYAEARLLVNRELYWIWLVALPISLARQVVLAPPLDTSGAPQAGVPAHRRPAFGRAVRPLTPAVREGLVRRRRHRHLRNALKERVRRSPIDPVPTLPVLERPTQDRPPDDDKRRRRQRKMQARTRKPL